MNLPDQITVINGTGVLAPGGIEQSQSNFKVRKYSGEFVPVAALSTKWEERISELIADHKIYREVDRSVLIAILAARNAFRSAEWESGLGIGINIGSSRGATGIFERRFREFELSPEGRVPPLTSPLTTTGNVSSWVAQDLETDGVAFSHSVTCSTGLHALGNALAWLRSGMSRRFIAGGVEAPLTPFTVAQMRALRIYSGLIEDPFPCRPLVKDATESTMVLGEGGALFALEQINRSQLADKRCEAVIESFGVGIEPLSSPTSLSAEGLAIQLSMRQAIEGMCSPEPIDAVIFHAPGTLIGDAAEIAAAQAVFDELPAILSNKWSYGHTLGASGALSLATGINLIRGKAQSEFPYPTASDIVAPAGGRIRKVLVNAVGFGGNAASIIISDPGLFQV